MEAVLAAAADEVVRFVQRLLTQGAGAVARFGHNQHVVLRGRPERRDQHTETTA